MAPPVVHRRRRYLLLLLASLGASGFAAYRIYRSPAFRRFLRLTRSLLSAADLASDSAENLSLVSSDVRRFILSDSDDVPRSVRQIFKLARSDEFCSAVSRVSEAVTVGALRGYERQSACSGGDVGSVNFTDRVLDRVFSPAGSGFASVVVGSFARNMVLAYFSVDSSDGGAGFLDTICDDNCRKLVADCVQKFVGTAVSIYLEKTMQINTYDELFSGLTNQRHETRVKDLLVSVCNGAVETLVRTSHEVLVSSSDSPGPPNLNSLIDSHATGSIEHREGLNLVTQFKDQTRGKEKSLDEAQGSGGWIKTVSSTLSVPSNRRFVLDVTGRVAFESVRSFLEYTMLRVSRGVRSGMNIVHQESLDKGMEVLRHRCQTLSKRHCQV